MYLLILPRHRNIEMKPKVTAHAYSRSSRRQTQEDGYKAQGQPRLHNEVQPSQVYIVRLCVKQ